MEPIAGSNRFALLLRRRLIERARLAEKGRSARTSSVERGASAPSAAPLSSIVGNKDADDPEARRILVEHLLSAGFGDQLINQAKFQQLVKQVTGVMEADPALLREMTKLLRALR